MNLRCFSRISVHVKQSTEFNVSFVTRSLNYVIVLVECVLRPEMNLFFFLLILQWRNYVCFLRSYRKEYHLTIFYVFYLNGNTLEFSSCRSFMFESLLCYLIYKSVDPWETGKKRTSVFLTCRKGDLSWRCFV